MVLRGFAGPRNKESKHYENKSHFRLLRAPHPNLCRRTVRVRRMYCRQSHDEDDQALGFLTLEFSLNLLAGQPGRLRFFDSSASAPITVSSCLTTPSSMVYDKKTRSLVITQLGPGRLISLRLP